MIPEETGEKHSKNALISFYGENNHGKVVLDIIIRISSSTFVSYPGEKDLQVCICSLSWILRLLATGGFQISFFRCIKSYSALAFYFSFCFLPSLDGLFTWITLPHLLMQHITVERIITFFSFLFSPHMAGTHMLSVASFTCKAKEYY